MADKHQNLNLENIKDFISFHHIGIACKDIEKEMKFYQLIGYSYNGKEYIDINLGIRCRFMSGSGPRIELVTEHHTNVLQPYLNRNTKMYHMAFKTKNFLAVINYLKLNDYKTIIKPTPAIAFGDKNVCFLMSPTFVLIELIEVN